MSTHEDTGPHYHHQHHQAFKQREKTCTLSLVLLVDGGRYRVDNIDNAKVISIIQIQYKLLIFLNFGLLVPEKESKFVNVNSILVKVPKNMF